MCIQDIAISRRCRVEKTDIVFATNNRFKPNPDRVGLYVAMSIVSGEMVLVAPSELDLIQGRSLISAYSQIPATNDAIGSVSVHMTYATHPAMIHGDLWVRCPNSDASVYEVIMQDDLANELRQYLKQERDKYGRK